MNGSTGYGSDRDVVARLLGRPPAGAFTVVVRRPDGVPAVIENFPFLDDGSPMPTRYWLVDRALREEVSRLEAEGGVRRAAAQVPAEAISEAHARYAAERDVLVPPDHEGPSPSGGVGGTRRAVKCLHAHLAWYLAGGDDPVGHWTAEELGVELSDFVLTETGDRVAAVDCGTNSTRLIVVDDQGTVLAREMRITRLGEGVDATRRLSRRAIDRTLSVLQDYHKVMEEHAVTHARVVATSAARDAVNSEEFMAEAARILGVGPEVLSGDEEGRLSFLGATAHLPQNLAGSGPRLVVDIGGGSTELSVGELARAGRAQVPRVSTVSLDLGCVRVTERFLSNDPPTPAELARARDEVRAAVETARKTLPPLEPGGLVIGLAGTVCTVASLERAVPVYVRALLHHAELARARVEHWLRILSDQDADARLRRPGMIAGREDVIVAGVLILAVVMEVFDRDRCLYSEDDILEGLARGMLAPAEGTN